MKNIPNPYLEKGLTKEQIVRIQADVSFDDRNLLRSVCPEQGIYTFTLAHLLIKVCNELRKRQITDFSRENEFRNAIVNCRIELGDNVAGSGDSATQTGVAGIQRDVPNGAFGRTMPEATAPYDGGRAKDVRPGDTTVTNKPSSVSSGGGKEGKGKGDKGKVKRSVK